LRHVRKTHTEISDIRLFEVIVYFIDIDRCPYFEGEFRKRFPNENPKVACKQVVALPGKIQIEMKVLAQVQRHDMDAKDTDLVFVGGDQTGNPPADFSAQFDVVFKNLMANLASQGLDLSNLLDMEVYMKDLDKNWLSFNDSYSKCFVTDPRPVRTTIGVAGLPLDWSIQLKAKAWKPAKIIR
jgi:enamine deaminase RidA (YjgF/YER057c/UK114 family)